MDTQLSSRWTFFYKFISPVLATGGMVYGCWRAFVHPDEMHLTNGMRPEQAWMIVLALALVVAALILWTVAPLKRLVLTGDDLLISNFLTEIRVPLSAIEEIGRASVTNPRRYTITFAEPTDFGRRITFLPPMVWSMNPFAESEALDELRSAWAAAQAAVARTQR